MSSYSLLCHLKMKPSMFLLVKSTAPSAALLDFVHNCFYSTQQRLAYISVIYVYISLIIKW